MGGDGLSGEGGANVVGGSGVPTGRVDLCPMYPIGLMYSDSSQNLLATAVAEFHDRAIVAQGIAGAEFGDGGEDSFERR